MIIRAFQYLILLFLVPLLTIAQSLSQISFVAFNADGNDDFAFVTLASIAPNTTIYLTDNEVLNDSSLNSGEGILAWANANTTAAGTVVIISDASSSATIYTNVGTIQSISGNFNLSASGDALIAYLGPSENEVSHWLSALENSANEAGNISVTSLISSQAYIQFNQTSSPDGGYYQGPRSGETNFTDYRSLILDPNNWHEEVSNGTAILPISTAPFSTLSASSATLVIKNFSDSLASAAQQGKSSYLIGDFQLIAFYSNTAVLNITLPFSGSADSGDFQSFQLRSSTTGNILNSTLLANIANTDLLNDTLPITGLNIPISAGDTLVIHLLAAIDSNANSTHNFQLTTPLFGISQGQQIDSTHNSFLHEIIDLRPQILFGHSNYAVHIDSLAQDSSDHPLQAFQINSRYKPSSLLSLSAHLQGSFQPADIAFFKLWYSNDAIFNPQQDQLLSLCNFIDSAGFIEFSGINTTLQKNVQQHFFISIDLNCNAIVGNNLRIGSLDSSYFKFDKSVAVSGEAGASAAVIICELLPQNVNSLSYQLPGIDLSVNWINPSCSDEVVMFIHNQAFSDSIIGQFAASTNNYADSTNSTLASGARAVYTGQANAIIINGLIAGHHYYGQIFTRKGLKYSAGLSFDFFLPNDPALIISQYYEGASNDKWIEISNVGDTAIDLTNFYLGRWSNTSQPSASASSSNQLTGILSSGSTILMQHSSAANPLYASGTSGGALAFNGNDALAICRNSADWNNRIDCLYSSGNWGVNTSFYRQAWVLEPQRNIANLNGAGEWEELSITAVDAASVGTTGRLGEHQFGLASGDFTYNGISWLPQNPQGISTSQNSVVIQSGSATLSANVSCSYLQVLRQAKLQINSNAALTVKDSILNFGEIILSNKATIMQTDTNSSSGNSGSGTYTIKRIYQATAADRFKLWSSPLGNVAIENSFANTNPFDRYYYQAGGQSPGYKSYINGKMQAGRAYVITPNLPLNPQHKNFSDSIVFQGDTLNSGDINIQIDSLNAGDYIFLGNPYPSALDFSLFLAQNNNINGSIWYWDASPDDKGNSAFAVWNNQGAVAVGNSKKAAPSNIIPAMQGFIIRAGQNIGVNSLHTFIFKNSMRVAPAAGNIPFYKSHSSAQKILLRLRSSKAENLCLISLNPSASQQYEELLDAPIYKANQNQSFYSIAKQKHLSIQTIDSEIEGTVVIPLGIDAWHTGHFSIILDSTAYLNNHLSITLIDSLALFERDLKSQAYSFEVANIGIDTARFFLKLGKAKEANISTNLKEAVRWQAYQNQAGRIQIDLSALNLNYSELQLIDLRSQIVESWPLENGQNQYSLPLSSSREGVFILKLCAREGTAQSSKIYLRK